MVEKVVGDTTGKYSKTTEGTPIDNAIERFQSSMAYTAIAAHEDLPTIDDFESCHNPNFFLRRQVKCLNDIYPGHVAKYSYKRGKDLDQNSRLVFVIKWYFESQKGINLYKN